MKPTRTRHRSKPPRYAQKDGRLTVLCPFCDDDHPIGVDAPAHCGTVLQVTAVQDVWKNAKCDLCGEMDNTPLTRVGANLQHIRDCKPGTRLRVTPPKHSLTAKWAFKLADRTNWKIIAKLPKMPLEIKVNGVVTGYAWE